MSIQNKSKVITVALLSVATFLFLQVFNAYHFYYIEQSQLFQTTFFYFAESVSHPGGFTEYISHFLMQFFIVPYLGAVIETIILLLIYFASSKFILKHPKNQLFFFAPATIFLSFLLMSFDVNIFFQGFLSYLFCIYALAIFSSASESLLRRMLIFLIIPSIYWLAGSVSILFAFSFFLNELIYGTSKKRIGWLFLPVFALFVSWLSVRLSITGNLRAAFLPDMYYESQLSPPFILYIPWILLLVWIPVVSVLEKLNFSGKKQFWVIGIQTVLVIILFGYGFSMFRDQTSYEVKKIDYYARNKQWDKIIAESAGKDVHNYLYLNYLNLALAEEDCLLEKIFLFNQKGSTSLEVSNQKRNLISALLSDINFSAGNIASSQQYAFEGYETSPGGGSGRLLKRLIETNLIYGEYAIAEKYIGLLEHTLFYRKWANQQRKFLYNDSLCLIAPQLAEKIKCLPVPGSWYYTTGGPETFKLLTDIHPSNEIAQDYFFAYLLLSKDLKLFTTFFEQYEQKGMLPASLPESVQQALLICYESQPEKWKEKGITDKTINQYRIYKSTFAKNLHNPKMKENMQKQFSTTYWFYFQFITI